MSKINFPAERRGINGNLDFELAVGQEILSIEAYWMQTVKCWTSLMKQIKNTWKRWLLT
jgi:hypothetical protein